MTPTHFAEDFYIVRIGNHTELDRHLNVFTGDLEAMDNVVHSVTYNLNLDDKLPGALKTVFSSIDEPPIGGQNCFYIPTESNYLTTKLGYTEYSVYIIKNIEHFMPPRRQQVIIPQLLAKYPKTQFIISTQSPLILASVMPENVWITTNFSETYHPERCYGLDADEIYTEILNVTTTYAPEFALAIREIDVAISLGESEKANNLLDKLEKEVGTVPAILGLRTQLAMF